MGVVNLAGPSSEAEIRYKEGLGARIFHAY